MIYYFGQAFFLLMWIVSLYVLFQPVVKQLRTRLRIGRQRIGRTGFGLAQYSIRH